MNLLNTAPARLMRLHQPVGIWLLLWPCWWSVALASNGKPSLLLLALFALGAVLMRSSGCIVNDIADRDLDKHVERTRNRPLASGEMTLHQSLLILFVLVSIAGLDALYLGKTVVLWALASLPLVITYPFMKRITWWPQLFLGFTFNWGALMGWAAVRGTVELPAVLLYAGGIFWTLGYDTIYAHQDKLDDAKVSIKSTALRLGERTRTVVGVFYLLAIAFWCAAGWAAGSGMLYFTCMALAQLHFGHQLCKVQPDDPLSCRKTFISNTKIGWFIFAGTLLSGM